MRAEPRHKPLPPEAVALLGESRLIDAIKVVRAAEGLGLKDAKNRVDAYLAQEPLLRVQIDTQQRAMRRKLFLWFLLVDVVITVGIIYWFFYRGRA